jgi:hypothetical protein
MGFLGMRVDLDLLDYGVVAILLSLLPYACLARVASLHCRYAQERAWLRCLSRKAREAVWVKRPCIDSTCCVEPLTRHCGRHFTQPDSATDH